MPIQKVGKDFKGNNLDAHFWYDCSKWHEFQSVILITCLFDLGTMFSIRFACVSLFLSSVCASVLSDLTLLWLLGTLISSCHQLDVQSDCMVAQAGLDFRWLFMWFCRHYCSVAQFPFNPFTAIGDNNRLLQTA